MEPLKAAQGRPTEEPYEVSHTSRVLVQTEFPRLARCGKENRGARYMLQLAHGNCGGGAHTVGNVKLLPPPRQSRGSHAYARPRGRAPIHRVVVFEDAAGEPVGAHVLSNVLGRVQFGRVERQEDWRDVAPASSLAVVRHPTRPRATASRRRLRPVDFARQALRGAFRIEFARFH